MSRSRLHPLRRALVLGAGSDIAVATLSALAEQGLQTAILCAREPGNVSPRVRAAAPGLETVERPWDALDVDDHVSWAAEMFDRHGPIDVVVCAVGMLGHHAGVDMSPIDTDLMARTNFAGPASAIAALVPHLVSQGYGSIVVLSSVAAARARKSNYVYGSTKAALDAYAQGLGDALVGTKVNVVIVRPGFVRSKMTEGLDPAPFSRTPDVVATAITRAVNEERSQIVWVPSILGPLMATMRVLPLALWRRVAGDR